MLLILEDDEKVGSGAFGIVFKGYFNKEVVAIKQLSSTAINEKNLEDFRKEANLMKKIKHHENIVQLIGVG